jgi:hypothetical protein
VIGILRKDKDGIQISNIKIFNFFLFYDFIQRNSTDGVSIIGYNINTLVRHRIPKIEILFPMEFNSSGIPAHGSITQIELDIFNFRKRYFANIIALAKRIKNYYCD